MQVQHTPETRWTRADTVGHVVAFEAALLTGTSQRAHAAELGVPRTTLQYWVARKNALDASPTLVGFFESPDGLAFLHRLVIALEFVMRFVAGCGRRAVQKVLQLAGLEPFVANSDFSRAKLGTDMEAEIQAFTAQERPRLAQTMTEGLTKPRPISVCQDETFHPEVCLVAIEPVSNYILLEQYAKTRDSQTWSDQMSHALAGLPVQVVQSTSDEGKGLLAHVRDGLGAHHGPDVFHVQQELSRATSVTLASQVRQAAHARVEATDETSAERQEAVEWAQTAHGPGRPPDFAARLARAEAAETAASDALVQAEQRQERAHQAIRGLSEAYHPVDLNTGVLRTAVQVSQALTACVDEVKAVASEAALPERCLKGIAKARRVLPAMVHTITFFQQQIARQLATLDLAPAEECAVKECLLPAAYLDRAARKARQADTRYLLRQHAERLRADAAATLAAVDDDRRTSLERVAQDGADLFQRSSSCVEGRNGQLALRHHSLHRLSATRLEALTAVHNYFIQRSDGTTAAERFFGTKPANLFSWLLDHLQLPARPAKKRAHDRLVN